jgi:hypothetical protein
MAAQRKGSLASDYCLVEINSNSSAEGRTVSSDIEDERAHIQLRESVRRKDEYDVNFE